MSANKVYINGNCKYVDVHDNESVTLNLDHGEVHVDSIQEKDAPPVNKFADLFNPDYMEKAEKVYQNYIIPLIEDAKPSADFQEVDHFLMKKGSDDVRISKNDIYKAFGQMRSYFKPGVTTMDAADYLSQHVEGMSSLSAWRRNMI